MKDARYGNLVQTVITLLEGRNPFNVDHCKLVAHYSEAVARRAGLAPDAIERLRHAAQLHTLGVLLQLEEKQLHRALPITGWDPVTCRARPVHGREEEILRNILGGTDGLDECIPIIVQRHEWFDGSGSLLGLSGPAILEEARVLSVADAFVDLATPKSHRDPLTLQEVLQQLRDGSGSQFDPRHVEHIARYVLEDEERWGASARSRRLEQARSRHWLGLGHFYRVSSEAEWALRCYRAAEGLAEKIGDADLLLEAVTGQFLVFCNGGELERAHQTLTRARAYAPSAGPWPRQWYLLQWGLLEWQRGNEQNGEQIVEGVLGELTVSGELAGRGAAMAILSHMALMRRGVHDATHLRLLGEFMQLLAEHDLFDVIITYRPQTIPLLLSALVHDLQPALARNLLTRMGEPCQGRIGERLVHLPPAEWMGALHPQGATVALRAARSEAAEAKATHGAATDGESLILPSQRAKEAAVRIHMLGQLRLEADGHVVVEDDWPTQKAMKLFAYLVMRRGNPASDQALMELFWPLAEEERARNSLRNAVHQIRSVLRGLLGDKAKDADLSRSRRTGTLTLQLEAFVDVDAVEDAVRAAAALSGQSRHQAASALLSDALGLYRGEFLDTVRDDWSMAPRTRLTECNLRALDLLARCHLATGDAEAAEVAARKALACDDLQEEGHANLVEALAAQGRRTDALRHYQSAVVHFKREMGLDAPARLTALYEKLLK